MRNGMERLSPIRWMAISWSGAVFPSILRTDPRYFRRAKGRFGRRFGYAVSRVLVARKDSGGNLFNIPEFAGNATAIAISNVYYPASDRSFTSSVSGFTVQMGIDAFGNELKEFWPDIHGYLQRRHARHQKENNRLTLSNPEFQPTHFLLLRRVACIQTPIQTIQL